MPAGHSPPSHPRKNDSRGAMRVVVIVGVFVAVVVTAAVCHGCASARQQRPESPGRLSVAATAPTTAPAPGHWPCAVISTHDGDTFTAYVTFDDPLLNAKGTVLRHVRIAGINAPELKTPQGPAAREALVKLLAGGNVEVEAVKASDDFGRLVARVWAGGVNVGDEMIRQGFAVPFMVPASAVYPTAAEIELARRTGNSEAVKRDRPPAHEYP